MLVQQTNWHWLLLLEPWNTKFAPHLLFFQLQLICWLLLLIFTIRFLFFIFTLHYWYRLCLFSNSNEAIDTYTLYIIYTHPRNFLSLVKSPFSSCFSLKFDIFPFGIIRIALSIPLDRYGLGHYLAVRRVCVVSSNLLGTFFPITPK